MVPQLAPTSLANAAPNITNLNSTPSFNENALNSTAELLASTVTLTDNDSNVFEGGQISLTYLSGASAFDQFTVQSNGNIAFDGTMLLLEEALSLQR